MGRRVGGAMEQIGHRHRAGHGQRGRSVTRATNRKIRKGRFSGKISNEVYVNSRYGQVVRSRPSRAGRSTTARQRAKENLARDASRWRGLSDRQFAAWAAAAKEANSRSPGGTAAALDGYHLTFGAAKESRVARPPEPFPGQASPSSDPNGA